MKPYTVVLIIEVQAENPWEAAEKFYEAVASQPPVNVLPTGTPSNDALESLLDGAADNVKRSTIEMLKQLREDKQVLRSLALIIQETAIDPQVKITKEEAYEEAESWSQD